LARKSEGIAVNGGEIVRLNCPNIWRKKFTLFHIVDCPVTEIGVAVDLAVPQALQAALLQTDAHTADAAEKVQEGQGITD